MNDARDPQAPGLAGPGAEIFAVPRAADPLAFTGERLTSAIGGQVEIEHLHRYCLARQYCHGLDVLDVACGEGYGAALLAQVARSVLGVDVEQAAIAHAERSFAAPGLRFRQGQATALPLEDASVDAVVSFETIEHFAAHEDFLREIRRVMRPGGLLIASSPDRDFYSPPGSPPNPFHVRELNRAEFIDLLGRHFRHVSATLQRPLVGSVLAPATADGAALPLVFERRGDSLLRSSSGLPHAVYVVAVASDRVVAQPPSLFIQHSDLDGPARQLAEAQAAARAEVGAARAEAEALRGSLARSEHEGEALRDALRTTQQDAAAAQVAAAAEQARLTSSRDDAVREAASLELRLRAIEQSTVWKASWPLRRFAQRHPAAARLARRLLQGLWWTVTLQLPARIRMWRRARAERRGAEPPPPEVLTEQVDPAAIVLPVHAEPVVSIVIPTYGQVDHTLRCLLSIAAAPPATAFEVIVAEDASGDGAIAQLRLVANIRLIENPANLGFLHNANAAAATALGAFVLFLNNDTQLQPGAIDALCDLLRERPDAGAAGAKLIYPDGRLQEAGGIIWDDASGWNYGRLDDPRRPVYEYVREADYVSGAALLVRRALFQSLGGFDPHFAPAYCEDSDLAFRIRAQGLKVLYQPRAVVVHFEGVSHGTDLAQGMKAYQVINQRKLAERWRTVLAAEHFPSGTHVLRARDRARLRRVVLVIDHYVPQPDRDAGSRTIWAFMRALQQAGRVVKFWPENGVVTGAYAEALQQAGIELCTAAVPGGFGQWMEENGNEIDAVLLSRPSVAERFLPDLRLHTRIRRVYYGHDLHFARLRRQAEAIGEADLAREADEAERLERAVWRRADVVLYPSAEEAETALAMEPGITARPVLPYAFTRFASPRKAEPGAAILFVGGFGHPPNEDAAVWFTSEILPLILARVPAATLSIVGSNPTARVRALADGPISIAANVSDETLRDCYARARVTIVPLRFGAGVKLKVVEALAEGVPLVTTEVGAQGCPGIAEVVAIRADPEGFAEAVCRLLTDDAAWEAACSRQIAYAAAHFSEAGLRASLLDASGL